MKRITKLMLFAVLSAPLLVAAFAFEILSKPVDVLSYARSSIANYNFHTVSPKLFYRSAQMDEKSLRDVITSKQIKTVINLRRNIGSNESFSPSDKKIVSNLGAKYIHIPLNSGRKPTKERTLALLDALRSSERPILVHCTSGTHRTGFASLLWLLVEKHSDLEVAVQQLSPLYGYFSRERRFRSWLSSHGILDDSIQSFLKANQEQGRDFSTWAVENLPEEKDAEVLRYLSRLELAKNSRSRYSVK